MEVKNKFKARLTRTKAEVISRMQANNRRWFQMSCPVDMALFLAEFLTDSNCKAWNHETHD